MCVLDWVRVKYGVGKGDEGRISWQHDQDVLVDCVRAGVYGGTPSSHETSEAWSVLADDLNPANVGNKNRLGHKKRRTNTLGSYGNHVGQAVSGIATIASLALLPTSRSLNLRLRSSSVWACTFACRCSMPACLLERGPRSLNPPPPPSHTHVPGLKAIESSVSATRVGTCRVVFELRFCQETDDHVIIKRCCLDAAVTANTEVQREPEIWTVLLWKLPGAVKHAEFTHFLMNQSADTDHTTPAHHSASSSVSQYRTITIIWHHI